MAPFFCVLRKSLRRPLTQKACNSTTGVILPSQIDADAYSRQVCSTIVLHRWRAAPFNCPHKSNATPTHSMMPSNGLEIYGPIFGEQRTHTLNKRRFAAVAELAPPRLPVQFVARAIISCIFCHPTGRQWREYSVLVDHGHYESLFRGLAVFSTPDLCFSCCWLVSKNFENTLQIYEDGRIFSSTYDI